MVALPEREVFWRRPNAAVKPQAAMNSLLVPPELL